MIRSDTFAVSGAECVIALCQMGFEVARREPGRTLLRRASSIVLVPDLLVLPSVLLDRILEGADVSYAALFAAIEDLQTQPELRCVEAL